MVPTLNTSFSLLEDKMNFLEASGAQGTQKWGVRDGKPSLGMNMHCCPIGGEGGRRALSSFLVFFCFYSLAL